MTVFINDVLLHTIYATQSYGNRSSGRPFSPEKQQKFFFFLDLQPRRTYIFLLVTDTDIYTDRGDSCRLGTGRDLNLVLRWMWGFLPHLAGLPSFRRFLFATIASGL